MASSLGHVLSINDMEIHFPFEPYDVQKTLMSKVLDCIVNNQNGLLESPTGTGKTLSLLCAALAWQRKQRLTRHTEMAKLGVKMSKMPPGNLRAFDERPIEGLGIPTIIYASRTHAQLSQAVRELKRSFYKSVKAIVLGSRDLMCVHEEVSRMESSSAKIMACHVKIHAHTCAYYNNVSKRKDDPSLREPPVVDIEDMVKRGKQGRFCPFFMSRELVKEANIVFMPYNYLLDPKLRSSHGIDIKNSVIILDEGHNIAKICEEAVSFDLKSSTIASCIQEVTNVLAEFAETSLENNSLLADLSLNTLVQLKRAFLVLESLLDEVQGSDGALISAINVLRPLAKAGFHQGSLPAIIKDLDLVSTFLTGNNRDSTGCDKFGSALRVLNSQSLISDAFCKSYKVCIKYEDTKDKYSSKDAAPAKVFQFWCMNPAIGLETLTSHKPRCIILSSGTLSPIPFLVQELMTPFPVQLSNPHIITDKQLFASVVKCGPRNTRLSSTYENRNDTSYLTSLGEVILNVCSVVPKGVLVFFPSYVMLDICHKAWEANGTISQIDKIKKVLLEPRKKDAFVQAMETYYSCVKTGNGAVLMAVCRGKVSEGLDFSDDNGRAVIITGIPYSPARDPRILAKQQYVDQQVQGISGKLWYQLEACRALNQAVGRIIRHAHDYGAILLCDERCDYQDFQRNLSGWVESRLRPFVSFERTLQNLAEFFGASVQKERTIAIAATKVSRPYGSTQRPSRQEIFESISEQDLDLIDDDGVDFPVEVEVKHKKIKQPKRASVFDKLEARTPIKEPGPGAPYGSSKPRGSPSFNAPFPVYTKSYAAFSKTDDSFAVGQPKRKKIRLAKVNSAFCSVDVKTLFPSMFNPRDSATTSTNTNSDEQHNDTNANTDG